MGPDPSIEGVLVEGVAAFRPVQVLVLAWSVAAIAVLPRRADAWALAVVALGLRLGLTGPAGVLPLYKDLHAAALGRGQVPPPSWGQEVYGDGFASLLTLASMATGHPAEVGYAVTLVLSVLAVPWVVDAADRAAPDRAPWAGRAAGALVACAPTLVAHGQAFGAFAVSVGVVASLLAGLSRDDARGAWAAALSAALLVHLRPLLAGVAAVGLLAAWRVDRRAAAVGGVVAAVRVAEIGWVAQQAGVRGGASLNTLDQGVVAWLGGWTGADPSVTPWPFALLAAYALARVRRPLVWGGVLAALTVPYLHLHFAYDLVRMQLPSAVVLAVLAGIGAASVPSGWGRAAAAVALASGLWVARHPRGDPPWVWVAEAGILRAGLDRCPPDAAIVLPEHSQRESVLTWVMLHGRRRIVPPGASVESVPTPACRYVDVLEHLERPPDLRGWTPRVVATPAFRRDGRLDQGEGGYEIGWYER